ncbi:MAG: 3-beta hydroxysteroid dehydrogenase/isomerase [candidate division WWE3 bacterium GW2011_GWF2_41_45]|uniref:3-beta hydroxysteroid dehydrogenase/isomerase n=2 Tax=Katanobacteria TaxID=422282 RepID=A0A0G0YQR3_UNCKA|nr:MAG: 3-beta hydroxysteroid dehydrogenase/isomerase [candidate division WWE3 bacterium GW2011_GWC2_41_23]KKS09994.1 MAG: 3-beta hydroxysteroid dehydrogenase/isomerase [candidate division WWE3 bacterium GW2011_GWF2_41_45]KKS11954.1 MAG: 3-beta hydroxysteroid dehydrogenase/isomerase [candidate division WWE3 bacterium GW2011_GWF1_41_53]KKS19844.1 MAG: 3-beta hydroxysteroid dehydrogenase/isomerase [candidate division WWE3 bacterium GW2011_GWE1_41_72]KKS28522.1 MAG: 3-beta hydroxysteroid dehydroge
MTNMKILVTGAAGFIGSHLSERLKSLGHDVVGIDNFNTYYSPELKKLNAKDLEEQGVTVEMRDLAADDLTDILEGVEAVFHLAAQPGISAATPFDTYLRNNLVATHNLLEAVRKIDIKMFINISTSSVYGMHATEDETTSPKPTSYYGVTKLAAEQLALSYHRDKNLPVASARLFSVYGERERPEKLFPKLIYSILKEEPFPLHRGSQKHARSYTYVGDIVDGLVLIMDKFDACNGEIFNLGIDQSMTTGDAIKIVEKLLGKKAIFENKPKRPGDQKETYADISKAIRVLGYHPLTTPKQGLEKEVKWFKEKIWKKIELYQ